ncbi:MAG TPA: CHAT domain-containing protein [Kofleriaceae bacterium]|jgi:hypothetical protein|nr:CHAT domain-containing protein [Kofleriaceae bacterium]
MAMPAVFLAFANDWSDRSRHLRSLRGEGKAIGKALAPLVQIGLEVLPAVHDATLADVLDEFREHHDQIRVLHFGGHATSSTLLFEDDAGAPTAAHAKGLAGFLGEQPGLVLVFLNGCCTEPQVKRLRAAGVKAVVATTRAIQDTVASEFAQAFYAELAVRPLRSAFDTAVHAVQTHWGDDPRAIMRDVVDASDETMPAGEDTPPAWPWRIDCDPAYEAWMLRAELDQTARRSGRARLLGAAAAPIVILSSVLALSADARRTTCRAPGLRELCAATGIGQVPTAEEQAMWESALTQRSGDGLRAYLQAYPRGVYVDEARTRLAGCSHERVERLSPEKDVRYPLTINANRADLRSSEAEARGDAVMRGNRDAATACALLDAASKALSSVAEPSDWKCVQDGHRFTCGFDGEIVCHVRDRSVSNEERCGETAEKAEAARAP